MTPRVHSPNVRGDATDLNYLFFRQQVERSMAESTATEAARKVHEALARIYEEQIEQLTGGGIRFRPHAD